ncbi:MAG: DUF6924 domain-containing protein [Actinoallomurus sp.]
MSFPQLPQPAPGEVLLLCTCYEEGEALWGGLPDKIGGHRDGDALVLEDDGVRLRMVEGRAWNHLRGGNTPALLPGRGPVPPVVVLADIPMVYGGDGPLLVDLTVVPGRGVRVPTARLGAILAALLGGALTFEDLVRAMDTYGMYEGDGGRPAFPTPTVPPRRSFPALPSTDEALLVRTSFDDEEGWRALLDELGGADENGWVGNVDWQEIDTDQPPLTALVVNDRGFEDLCPGQVPALVSPEEDTTLVALADTRTFAQRGRPLTIVDLHDTPGQSTVLPCREAAVMACNLQIGNMDFHEFVEAEDVDPWWES